MSSLDLIELVLGNEFAFKVVIIFIVVDFVFNISIRLFNVYFLQSHANVTLILKQSVSSFIVDADEDFLVAQLGKLDSFSKNAPFSFVEGDKLTLWYHI